MCIRDRASGEKHLPVAELSGSRLTVTVGAVEHPMADVHYIQWIFVETENGGQIRYLNQMCIRDRT